MQAVLDQALALVEVGGWTSGMAILDAMEKAAGVQMLQADLNDQPGVCLKLIGPPVIKGDVAAVTAAIDAGKAKVEGLGRLVAARVVPSPSAGAIAIDEALSARVNRDSGYNEPWMDLRYPRCFIVAEGLSSSPAPKAWSWQRYSRLCAHPEAHGLLRDLNTQGQIVAPDREIDAGFLRPASREGGANRPPRAVNP